LHYHPTSIENQVLSIYLHPETMKKQPKYQKGNKKVVNIPMLLFCITMFFTNLVAHHVPVVLAQTPVWTQLGNDIDGEAAYDYSGSSVSLSADGNVIAIGAVYNAGKNGSASGHVRVYEWDVNGIGGWTQCGDDIDGEAAGDGSGVSVSLSADGSVVAIGALWNDGNGYYSGHVCVYEWDVVGREWMQRGDDIDGEAAYNYSGESVSLSADGNVVAIGAPYNDGNGQRSGHVRVYEWDVFGRGWTQRGNDIDGEAAYDESGRSVSLSADGNVVAIGAMFNGGNGFESGHVRVYEWVVASSGWTQRGDDIDGEAADDMSGYSVSLSDDGSVVAISAYWNDGNGSVSGHVRVYEWDVAGSGGWTQRGNDIDGEAAGDLSGWSVSLNADGNVVAIGSIENGGNGTDSGHVRVYEWDVAGWSGWAQCGNDIDGEAPGDRSGVSVSLSGYGSVVAIGAYKNDGNGYNSGHVRVYKAQTSQPTTSRCPSQIPSFQSTTSQTPSSQPSISQIPSFMPTASQTPVWTQLGNDIDGEAAYDESGRSISLSADGNVVAIGSINNDGNGYDSGHVRIYEWDMAGRRWTQRGDDIDGEAAYDESGWSVSLSADGNVVAIGALWHVGNETNSGHVRVYEWDVAGSVGWTQRGDDIDGEAAYDIDIEAEYSYSGASVSLNVDGSVVAIGAPWNDGKNGPISGHVRVYEWDMAGRRWTQRGDDIDGEAPGDWSGSSVSLSADGNVVAIGAPTTVDWNGPQRYGHVRVHEWDVARRGWTQRGDDIDGEAANDMSGRSVSLSADGSVIAIGAPWNDGKNGPISGHVRVYEWDMAGRRWTQRGNDIDGEAAGDGSGVSVSLNADGRVVAIGAFANDGNSYRPGHVRVYEWDVAGSVGWTQCGDDIDGEAADDWSGWSVSLSADGSVVAIGAYKNDGNGYNSGHVRVYKAQTSQPNTSVPPSSLPSTSQIPSVKPSTSQMMPSFQPSVSQTPSLQPSTGQAPSSQPSTSQIPSFKPNSSQQMIPSFQPSSSQTPSFQPSTSQTPSSQPSTSPNSLTHFLYLNILITSFMVIYLANST
jgi:hypothetical protein